MALVVIEGPDLTGKSTLAARLGRELSGVVRHAGKPEHHPIDEYETALTGPNGETYVPLNGYSIILDRWHLGERVWPVIFDRETQLDDAVARHLELFMKSRGAVYVVGDRDDDRHAAELVEAGEPLKPEDLDRCRRLFHEALEYGGEGWHRWNHATMSEVDAAVIMGDALRREYQVSAPYDWTTEWIGTPDPYVLLVGERPGPVPAGARGPHVPFAPYPATSGHYLMRALPDTWWFETAIINTYREDGRRQHLLELWAAFGAPRVIALGRVAAEELARLKIPHGSVPHPQWWRRFQHHDLSGYTRAIIRAARGEHYAAPGI